MNLVADHAGQPVKGDDGLALCDGSAQIDERRAKDFVHLYQAGRISSSLPCHGILHQGIHQLAHSAGAGGNELQVFCALVVQPYVAVPLQQFRVDADRSERLSQVVRGAVGKLPQFGIGSLQQFGVAGERRAPLAFPPTSAAALSVTSRNTSTTPMIFPSASRMGAALSSIGMCRPSREVSRVWLASPTIRSSRSALDNRVLDLGSGFLVVYDEYLLERHSDRLLACSNPSTLRRRGSET